MIKKIFFSDLDGTLLNKNHKISLFTKQIIKKIIKEEDYLFVVNTGRILDNAIKMSKKLGCHKQTNGYVISNNGAQIYSLKEKKIIYDKFLLKNEISLINKVFFDQNNIDVHYYSSDSIFVYHENYVSKYWSKLMDANYKIIDNVSYFDSLENNNIKISRLLIIFKNEVTDKDIKILNSISDVLPKIEIKKQTKFIYELTKKNVNKGTASQFISKKLNIKKNDTISFGDSYNDFSLIKKAGTGLVVKNGVLELKNIADGIIEGNHNNGPALYIWKNFIRKEYN